MTHLAPAPPRAPARPRSAASWHRWGAVVCAALAGVAHAVSVPHALEVGPVLGGLFVLVALGQCALAGLLAVGVPSARLLLAALVAQTAVVAAYVVTRTVDLPFMPVHGRGTAAGHVYADDGAAAGIPVWPGTRIEPVGTLDLLTLDAELVLIGLLLAWLPPAWRGRTATGLALTGIALVGIRVLAGP